MLGRQNLGLQACCEEICARDVGGIISGCTQDLGWSQPTHSQGGMRGWALGKDPLLKADSGAARNPGD